MSARSKNWDPLTLPDLAGHSYLITGANRGLGYFAAEQLARSGARVVLSGRNPNRMAAARAALGRRVPGAKVETLLLDTSNLGSVRAAAASVRGRGRLDGLLLNAGIVHPPRTRQTVRDGHELVLATNVLGHFALAGALLTTLAGTSRFFHDGEPTRMVWTGSIAPRIWRHTPVDPQLVEGYRPWRAYVQSKVATAALGFEADRRLRQAGVRVASVVAHPGYSISGRTVRLRGVNEPSRLKAFIGHLQTPVAQSKETGAWSLVRALVDPASDGGQQWAPRLVTKGKPRAVTPQSLAADPELGERLWALCEEATAVKWPFERAATA